MVPSKYLFVARSLVTSTHLFVSSTNEKLDRSNFIEGVSLRYLFRERNKLKIVVKTLGNIPLRTCRYFKDLSGTASTR